MHLDHDHFLAERPETSDKAFCLNFLHSVQYLENFLAGRPETSDTKESVLLSAYREVLNMCSSHTAKKNDCIEPRRQGNHRRSSDLDIPPPLSAQSATLDDWTLMTSSTLYETSGSDNNDLLQPLQSSGSDNYDLHHSLQHFMT